MSSKLTEYIAKRTASTLIKAITDYVSSVERAGLSNEQWFLDFEDSINAISCKDHNV